MMRRQMAWIGMALVLALTGTVGASGKPMPTFPDMEQKARFVEPCAPADPFIVIVRALDRKEEAKAEGLYPIFLFTRWREGQPSEEPRPYLILKTDEDKTFIYEWVDLNRDGRVDRERAISIVFGRDARDPAGEILAHVCGLARQLK